MSSLWTLNDIATALGVPVRPAWQGVAVSGVSIDTRSLQPDNLFVALAGTPGGGFVSSFASTGDGHAYVAAAAAKGAAAAVVSRVMEGVNTPQLVVDETHMAGLWQLGQAARARLSNTRVVALTGSAGKSTTKEFLAAMLGEVGSTYASQSSYNNFWGVPLTLANVPPASAFAVLEMGMNMPGEMARLAQLGAPHVALVVNVRPVHLELVGSLEGIRREKLAIAQGLVPGGTLVIPAELSTDGVDVSRAGRLVHFDVEDNPRAEVAAVATRPVGEAWHVQARVGAEKIEFMLAHGAPHRLWNAMAALGGCYALGIDCAKAAQALAGAGTLAGRGDEHQAGGVLVLDDSFNGNPASMAASLQALKARPTAGRKLALLGDMLELGAEAPHYHAALAAECAGLDGVLCVGPLMRHLADALPPGLLKLYEPDPDKLTPAAVLAHLQPGDTLVVKGSKKMFYVRKFVPGLVVALRG